MSGARLCRNRHQRSCPRHHHQKHAGRSLPRSLSCRHIPLHHDARNINTDGLISPVLTRLGTCTCTYAFVQGDIAHVPAMLLSVPAALHAAEHLDHVGAQILVATQLRQGLQHQHHRIQNARHLPASTPQLHVIKAGSRAVRSGAAMPHSRCLAGLEGHS